MTVQFEKTTGPVILKNGASLWLPANVIKGLVNLGEPDIYAESTTQLYPLGAKLEFADGRVFRYGKFGVTSTTAPRGYTLYNGNYDPEVTSQADVDGFFGDLYVAAVVGQEYVDLEKATEYAENFFEDGLFVAFPTGTDYANHLPGYRICGSEKGTGVYCRIYLESPLKANITVTDGVDAFKSIFSKLKVVASIEYTTIVGVCMCSSMTANSFGWIQRKGRCYTPQSATIGDGANERMVGAAGDGTITPLGALGRQPLGYITEETGADGYGNQYWLQLE